MILLLSKSIFFLEMHTKLLLLICLCFVLVHGLSRTLIVCKSCKINSIKDAVNQAASGDIIDVKKGIYKEHNIDIKKPLTIFTSENAIIDGNFNGNLFNVFSNNVKIKGFKLVNTARSYTKDYAAILLYKVKNFEVTNNTLETSFFGIMAEKSKIGLIANNVIIGEAVDEAGSGNGVHLWYCSDLTIDHNNISHMRDGIYLEFVSGSKITSNNSHNNLRYGLHFMFSNNDQYQYNTFRSNGAGVAVMFSKFVKMTHNVFYHNWGASSYGLLLKEIYDCEIYKNSFKENTTGIYLEGSTRVVYQHNYFVKNGWAVKVIGSSYSNKFSLNNFLNNSFDISYSTSENDNKFNNNYWSSYSGYDLDKNGIGDVPYRPVKLFSYIVNRTPETMILFRSLFIDIINFSEKVSPIFIPEYIIDKTPLMKPVL